MKWIVFCAALFLTAPACKSANAPPPNLTPQAQTAWRATQVIKAMDVIRDIAIDANKTTPPALATETTRKVVTWHRSALIIVHQAPAGWQTLATTSFTEVMRQLPENDKRVFQPYTTLLLTLLQEIQ